MTLSVSKGRGYVTASEHIADTEEQEVGLIAVDSIYSPVTRVRYATEDARVGQKTDYDRLILEIWTNGTITPEMALVEASKILRKHLNPFVQYFELGSDIANDDACRAARREQGDDRSRLQQKLNMTIQELDLSVRANNCLEVGQDPDRARSREEDRRGSAEGPQLRQDQPARSEAQARRHGPEPGHGSRSRPRQRRQRRRHRPRSMQQQLGGLRSKPKVSKIVLRGCHEVPHMNCAAGSSAWNRAPHLDDAAAFARASLNTARSARDYPKAKKFARNGPRSSSRSAAAETQ
jgi:hypothetical protein